MIRNKLFDPNVAPPEDLGERVVLGDRRDGAVYEYDDRTVLSINVALATGRPLLMRGPSGCGKSSLARHVARVQHWRYYERVISSRSQAQDLLWELDHMRRLHDAQVGQLATGLAPYIRPGLLWWAFDQTSAARQTAFSRSAKEDPPVNGLDQSIAAVRAVILIDEIDKADPDVPNNLLVPLGSLQFEVEDTGEVVRTTADQAPLVIVTTNDERELPSAFLRRCVELEIRPPDLEQLVRIGQKHFPNIPGAALEDIASRISSNDQAPSPAEYLDVVRTWHRLGEDFDPEIWEDVLRVAVRKPGRFAGSDL